MNCYFKNSSSIIALFNNTPAIFPVEIAYGTARRGLVLSPQANSGHLSLEISNEIGNFINEIGNSVDNPYQDFWEK